MSRCQSRSRVRELVRTGCSCEAIPARSPAPKWDVPAVWWDVVITHRSEYISSNPSSVMSVCWPENTDQLRGLLWTRCWTCIFLNTMKAVYWIRCSEFPCVQETFLCQYMDCRGIRVWFLVAGTNNFPLFPNDQTKTRPHTALGCSFFKIQAAGA